MKNQYNFIKPIDHNSSTSSNNLQKATNEDKKSGQQQQQQSAPNGPLPVKSSFTKLHNLVTSKFTQHQQVNSSRQTNSSNSNIVYDTTNQQPTTSAQRNARLFSLAGSINTTNNSNNNSTDELEKTRQQQMRAVAKYQHQRNNSSSTPKVATSESNKMTPELARCYDEIDQIYDYIRGLAPLPLQLRKIKSIDFEQLERDRRLREQQPQVTTTTSKQLLAAASGGDQLISVKVRQAKVRQREASDGGEAPQLKEPEESDPKARLVQGPLPIKVIASTCESGGRAANVKRVESLNLGLSAELRSANSSSGRPQQQQPSYLISSQQRGQLFRLPRAHSTSTLNKPPGSRPAQRFFGASGPQARQQQQPPQQPASSANSATRTLPALRLSRASILDPFGRHHSLNRPKHLADAAALRDHEQQRSAAEGGCQASPSAAHGNKPQKLASPGEPLDLVESFVDDDDASSVGGRETRSTSTSESSQSTAENLPPPNSNLANRQDNSDSDRSSCSSCSDGSGSEIDTCSSNSDDSSVTESQSSTQTSATATTSTSTSGSMDNSGPEPDDRKQSRSSEKWAEKSHSDYEDDTGSLTRESPSDDLLQPKSQKSSRPRRRSSSGAGTGGSSSQQAQSSAGSSVRGTPLRTRERSTTVHQNNADKQATSNNNNGEDEHIYEQIPAHKNLLIGLSNQAAMPIKQQQQLEHQNHTMAGNKQQSCSQFKSNNNVGVLFRQQQTQRHPFNYPVAYAPNVAAPHKQQVAAFMAATKSHANSMAAAIHQRHQHQLASGGGTFPLPLSAGVRSMGAPPQAVARPLDHRHRLSMSNIHLLHYLKPHPLHLGAGLYSGQAAAAAAAEHHHQMAAVAAAAKLSRSSSSSKVNRLPRAPRLSPAQLIAQIQMPRAVSKRQLQPSAAEFAAGSASATAADGAPKQRRHQQHPMQFLWAGKSPAGVQQQQHPLLASARLAPSPQAVLHQHPHLQAYHSYASNQAPRMEVYGSSGSNKRMNAHRLTAIGIEGALECARRLPQAQHAPTGSGANSKAGGLRETHLNYLDDGPRAFEPGHRRSASASYFEPGQLIKGAPLIDDDDDESPTGTTTASDESSSSPRRQKQQPQKSLASHHTRCLNSISDLHSFSSTSTDEEDGESQPSSSGSLVGRAAGQNRNQSQHKPFSRRANNNKSRDEGNFVSSSSFIKCYYGRERPTTGDKQTEQPAGTQGTQKLASAGGDKVAPDAKVAGSDEPKTRSKKRGSEKLLGLIGLNTGSARRASAAAAANTGSGQARPSSGKSASGSESSSAAQRSNAAAVAAAPSPIAALFASGQRASQPGKRNQPTLVGEFLNAEGPILVRDRRLAALRTDLVHYFEHPTVQVTSVPSFEQKVQQKLRQQQQQSNSTKPPSQQADKSMPLHRRFVSMLDKIGSTDTTNSTSSYEAAIKNSRDRSEPTSSQQATPAKQQSSKESTSTTNSEQAAQQQPRQQVAAASRSSKKTSSSAGQQSGGSLIKVPKLSKQSHLLNRPLPKPPTQPPSSGSRRASALALANAAAAAAATTSGSTGSSSRERQQQSANSLNRRKLLMAAAATTNQRVASAPNGVGGLLASAHSTLARLASGSAAPPAERQRHCLASSEPKRPTCRSAITGDSSTRTSSGVGGAGSLSPLQVAVVGTTQPSPTVTTCTTSSGISSRLTSGTHLPANAGASNSSQRSSSSQGPIQQRVKSLSELHKQSKQQQQRRRLAGGAITEMGLKEARRYHHQGSGADFALMDESDDNDDDAGRDTLPRGERKQRRKTRPATARPLSSSLDIDRQADEDAERAEVAGLSSKEDDEEHQQATMINNLKLFDERFSSKFVDKQLASSNDSLLESINFSGTLNRKTNSAATTAAAGLVRL